MSCPAGTTCRRCLTLSLAFSLLVVAEAVCLGLMAYALWRQPAVAPVSVTSDAARQTTGLRVEALAIGVIPAVIDPEYTRK